MKISLRYTVVTLAVLVGFGWHVQSVSAQNGFEAYHFTSRDPGHSSVTIGTAGAGLSLQSSSAALGLNPALMGYASQSTFEASLMSVRSNETATFTLGGSPQDPVDSEFRATKLSHVGLVTKVPVAQGSLAFGASFARVKSFEREMRYSGQNGLNSVTDYFMPIAGEFDITDNGDGTVTPTFYRDLSFIAYETFGIDFDAEKYAAGNPVPFSPAVRTGSVLQSGQVTETGGVNEWQAGLAIEAARDVMVGVSMRIPVGSYTFYRQHNEEDQFNENDGSAGTTDFDRLTLVESFSTDFGGIGFSVGVASNLTSRIRGSVVISTPTWIAATDAYDTELEVRFDNGDRYTFGQAAADQEGSGVFDYRIVTPWEMGVGIGYEGTNLTAAFDMHYADWSQLSLDADAYNFAAENAETRQNLTEQLQTRFSLSYRLGNLTWRGGWTTVPDVRLNPTYAVDRTRQYQSTGLSYQLGEGATLDLSWIRTNRDDAYAPYVEVNEAPTVAEKVESSRIVLGIRVAF
jgi:hypothetical protein